MGYDSAHKCRGKKIKYRERKWEFIQPHLANIQNTGQDLGKLSQSTTRNMEHVFRIGASNRHNPTKKTTRFDNEVELKQLEQMEMDIVSNGIFNHSLMNSTPKTTHLT